MQHTRLLLPFLVGLLLVTSACEDPSNVGVGLVGSEDEPHVVELHPTAFDTVAADDVTGNTVRVLSGQVDDPLFGAITASGFIDFTRAATGTIDAPVATAEIRLHRDYVYGDTTSELTFTLYDMPSEWDASGASADTTLPSGSTVETFTVSATDTLVVLPLPSDWITQHEATLREENFGSNFHGFHLEATAGNAVVGFSLANATFRTISEEEDTLVHASDKAVSTLRRTTVPSIPDSRVLFQDGVGPRVQLDFDVSDFEDQPINDAIFRLFADTVTVQQHTPPHFYRPRPERLILRFATEAGNTFSLGELDFEGDGHLRLRSSQLRDLLQQAMVGERLFTHLDLIVPPHNNSIAALLLFGPDRGETAPRVFLTTPSDIP